MDKWLESHNNVDKLERKIDELEKVKTILEKYGMKDIHQQIEAKIKEEEKELPEFKVSLNRIQSSMSS